MQRFRLRVVQIPLSVEVWARLQASFPMTQEEWNQMIAVLEAMKPGLIMSNRNEGAANEN